METNRRNWIKQTSLALVALGTVPLKSFAIPSSATQLTDIQDNNLIRLRSNENPYGPSPLARAAMTNSINSTNRYNWELTSELISNIAKKNNVIAENILMGAGSTEILDLAVRFTALDKGSFVLAEPTYNYWTETAQKLGLKKIAVPLTPDKRHDLPAMLKAIEPETKIIYICNPNNPTGTICDREALITFIKEVSKKTLVLLDEAYIDFTNQQSLASLVIENKNLIIAKTFSKIYGLAGARIGYAIANSETITQLSQLQSWPNGAISVVSVTGALASIKDEKFTNETYSLNEKAKKYTIEQLERLKITCIPSQTNFIYFSLANYKKDFFEQLKNNNILGTKIYEENGKWSRITIGTMQEMQKFINAIE
jgi:histidinol-phosphate aminotransferase